MKKLLVILAAVALVWAFAVPASAVDWNFYGSARMATFYIADDYGDYDLNGVLNGPDDDDDSGLQWNLQGNSRIGARVKGEDVKGRIELGINEATVTARLVYGTWDFGAGTLKVGKDYTPVSQFISGQVFDSDLGLLSWGTVYGFRNGQIALSFGGLTIAAITQSANDLQTPLGVPTGDDVDSYLPKLEASWGMGFDNFNFTLRGGFQYYEIEDQNTGLSADDIDVTSWLLAADGGFNFGPAYIKAAVSYDQNGGNAGWWSPAGTFDGVDDIDETNFFQAALVGGFKMSDMVTFEVGFGYTDIDSEIPGADNVNPWAAYGQAVIGLAPGVWVIPEVGYFDYDENAFTGDDFGNTFYLGAKWQIDF